MHEEYILLSPDDDGDFTGRFRSIAEIQRFAQSEGGWDRDGELRIQSRVIPDYGTPFTVRLNPAEN